MSKRVLAPSAEVRSFSQLLSSPEEASRGERGGRRSDPNVRAREEARSQGYAHGVEEGRDLGRAQAYEEHRQSLIAIEEAARDEAVATLDALQRRFVGAFDEFKSDMEERLTAIALAIAERVVCDEIAARPDIVVGIVTTALNEVMHGARVTVRANPFEAQVLRERQTEIERAVAHLESLAVVDDPSIRAGCIIDSDGCLIDARIEGMLARVGEALRAPMGEEPVTARPAIGLTSVQGGMQAA